METPVDEAFTKALPKVELHAHLSGSISKTTLHKIWKAKQLTGHCLDLEDPLHTLATMPDIFTFFKIFDQYIYKLINDRASLREAVHAVLDDFEDDGVIYLELRTTPRAIQDAGIRQQEYIEIVLDAMMDRPEREGKASIEAHLLVSVDRRMSYEEAVNVLELAKYFSKDGEWHKQQRQQHHYSAKRASTSVLGIDLCGNPMKGDVATFTDVFRSAKQTGMNTTVHFAEVPESSTDPELATILSWQPDRLGHVINVPDRFKDAIQKQNISLELCLSCNMIAKMVAGEYADHHFGYWLTKENAIALSTDDVGVFESSLSNEYLLAAKHFNLSRSDLVALAHRSADAAFKSQHRIHGAIEAFERSQRTPG